MRRAKHALSHYKLSTLDMGKLVPVGVYEALPGDTIQAASSALIRVSPLVSPVMHPVTVRLHHWFVPNRVMDENWEDFITGGPTGDDTSTPPTIAITAQNKAKGGLLEYMGIPTDTPDGTLVSAFPIIAYNKTFNEYYRDQDLVPERDLLDTTVANIAWEKDYFTSSRPWPQKGPDVIMPIGDQAPVKTNATDLVTGANTSAKWAHANGTTPLAGKPSFSNISGATLNEMSVIAEGPNTPNTGGGLFPTNLYADLALATGATINDVRRAFAIQRYQEARAMYGSRYTEYLRYLGVKSSDARLQRPEYLGGGKQTISFSEVLRTGAESTSSSIGEMSGHGIAAMRSRKFRKFFEEHGIVIVMMSVRPRTMYNNGIQKMWSRKVKEDYWQKELEQIGQQEVLNKEVYAAAAQPEETFGYQDRYAEYRHIPSTVAGDFRDTLNYWHLGRIFGSEPALNQSFVECDPSKRIHAVQTEHVLWAMISHSIIARRMVAKHATSRVL